MLARYLKPKKYSIGTTIILSIILPVFILAFWEFGGQKGFINDYLLPHPSILWKVFIEELKNGQLWTNISASFGRVIIGYFFGASIGIILGFLMGLFLPANKILSSVTSFLRSIPTIALVPLFILLFGIRELSKRTTIAYASSFPVLLNTINGIQNVDYKLCEVAYTYQISKSKVLFKIILPAALPSILTGLRLGVSSAWISVIAAEMFAASKGVGYMITVARDNSLIDTMFVYVFIIGIIGFAIDKVLSWIQVSILKKTRGLNK